MYFVYWLLTLISTENHALYGYYLNIMVDSFYKMTELLLNNYLGSPDVTKLQELMYNSNINNDTPGILKKAEVQFEKSVRSKLYTMVSDGANVGDVKEFLTNKYIGDKTYDGNVSRMINTYRTEYTRIRTATKLHIIEELEAQGIKTTKRWVYTYESRQAREAHLFADGTKANKRGYFKINGKLTKGPGMFGDPGEDINCRCDIAISIGR